METLVIVVFCLENDEHTKSFIVCIEIIPSRWFDNNGRFRSVRVEFGRFHGFFFPTNWLKYRCHNVYSLQHGRVAVY